MIGKYLEERSKNNLSYCALCAVTMEGCAAGKLHVLLPYCPLALVQKRNCDLKKKFFGGQGSCMFHCPTQLRYY